VTWYQSGDVSPVRRHPNGDVSAGQTSPMGIGNVHNPCSLPSLSLFLSYSLFFLPRALPFSFFFSFSLCALTTSIPPQLPRISDGKKKKKRGREDKKKMKKRREDLIFFFFLDAGFGF
jgi:hypothetical protein